MTQPQVIWDEAISFGGDVGTQTPTWWISVAERVRDSANTSRGKQYEWDQQQAAQYQPTLDNRDQALTPGNTASPYSPNVLPRRPYRKRFQFPVTQQLLTQDQATSGEGTPWPPGTVGNTFGCASDYDATPTVTTSASAWQGTQVIAVDVASGVPVHGMVQYCSQWTAHPGRAHSYQVHVRIPTGTVNVQVAAAIRWVGLNNSPLGADSLGTTTTITGGSATWITLTATGTPPATAAGASCGVELMAVPSGAFTMQVDGQQCELAAAPSTWTLPGVWGSILTGWTDRWPQVYLDGGTYTTTTPTVVDTFARFSQIFPQPPFYSDVLALDPDFFFPLDDPTSATVARDLRGNFNGLPIAVSQYGAGSLTFGNSISSTDASGGFLGSPGPVVTMANSVANTGTNAATFFDLTALNIFGPPQGNGWTRMIHFRVSAIPTTADTAIWAWDGPTFSPPFGGSIGLFIGSTGGGVAPGAGLFRFGTSAIQNVDFGNGLADGNWHQIIIKVDATGFNIVFCLDGAVSGVLVLSNSVNIANIGGDAIGAASYPGSNFIENAYAGDVMGAAEWPFEITNDQMRALFQSWKTAWSGDRSGDRYGRILGWANYVGAQNVPPGATQHMGPATDVDGQTDVFTLLNNVVTTENGNHYVSETGVVTFEPRTVRYNQLTPTWTFGADIAAGEFPYAAVATDFDLDHVANQVEITQQPTNQVFTSSIVASQLQFDTLVLQRTINVLDPQEAVDASTYLANRFAFPLTRIDSITLNPSRYPPLWAVLAGTEISTRVRVNIRPIGEPTVTPVIVFDGFVEQISWTVDPSTDDHLAVLQVSPADLNLYWVLSALHTTVHTAATAGATSIVLNALPDSAQNPARASFCFGLHMTLEPGTANAETLTVASFSATTAGYTSFTVTFTGAMAHNHAIGAVASEQLPTGVTDPTTWDIASILGVSTTLAY